MFIIRNVFLAAIAVIVAADATNATPRVFFCKMNSHSSAGVPSQVAIFYDDVTGQVEVMDDFINFYFGEPIVGRLKMDNAKRYTFGWTLKHGPKIRHPLDSEVEFSATIIKATNRIDLGSFASAFENNVSGGGTCEARVAKK